MRWSTSHLALFLLTASLYYGQTHGGKHSPKCNVTRHEEADTCMQRMFLLGDRTQRFRESIGQMKNYCKQIMDLQNCVKRFSQECLPELGRQVTTLLLYGVRKVNRQFCSSERGMVRFTEIAKCGNQHLDKKHACMDEFLERLRLVEKRTDEEMLEKRIHYVCCYFSHFKSCISDTFDIGDSSKRCPNEEIKQSVLDLIGGYAEDALDLVCGEFNDSGEKCNDLLKADRVKEDGLKEKAKRTGKGRSSAKHAKSILPYFVNIFGKI